VFTGGDKDTLNGGSGFNWFLGNFKGRGVLDKIVGRLAHDVVTDE
jgi:hypothetical protein